MLHYFRSKEPDTIIISTSHLRVILLLDPATGKMTINNYWLLFSNLERRPLY